LKKAKELLKSYFGYDSFRPGQEQIINSILAGKDTLGIMPTGGGKSVCYQIPALCLDGLTVVISPLISLMKDQTDQLKNLSYPCGLLNSTQSYDQQTMTMNLASSGDIKLLYLTPERFRSAQFMEWLLGIEISLFVVDEAHCISEWGHDFRPEYRKLSEVIKQLGNPPILAVTATATSVVRDDIVASLGMKKPFIMVTGFNRTNIVYGVQSYNSKVEKNRALIEFVNKVKSPGIIYASTIKDAQAVYNILSTNTTKKIGLYHGSLMPHERKQTQEGFLEDRLEILVATNAFGMGVNKPDVRFVVHYSIPGTLESFYQETGRAGRDGKLSFVLLLYMRGDEKIQQYFIKHKNISVEDLEKIHKEIIAYSVKKTVYSEDADKIMPDSKEMRPKISGAIKQLIHFGIIDTEYIAEDRFVVTIKKHKPSPDDLYLFRKLFVERDLKINNTINLSLYNAVKRSGFTPEEIENLLTKLQKNRVITFEKIRKGQKLIIKNKKIDNDFKKKYTENQVKKNEIDRKKLEAMVEYCFLDECRRKYLLDYFGEVFKENNCSKCDICRGTAQQRSDITPNDINKTILMFFECASYNIGLHKSAAILKGAYEVEDKYREWTCYGGLKEYSEEIIRNEITSLIDYGLLAYKKGEYRVIKLTKKGTEYIKKSFLTAN